MPARFLLKAPRQWMRLGRKEMARDSFLVTRDRQRLTAERSPVGSKASLRTP